MQGLFNKILMITLNYIQKLDNKTKTFIYGKYFVNEITFSRDIGFLGFAEYDIYFGGFRCLQHKWVLYAQKEISKYRKLYKRL